MYEFENGLENNEEKDMKFFTGTFLDRFYTSLTTYELIIHFTYRAKFILYKIGTNLSLDEFKKMQMSLNKCKKNLKPMFES